MTEHSFELGDKVRLKSGGPEMTVEEIGERGDTLTCVWCVEKKGVFERRDFHSRVVQKVTKDDYLPLA